MRRYATLGFALLTSFARATSATADDPKPTAKPIPHAALEAHGPLTAIAAARDAGEVWLASDKAGLVRYKVGTGVTWQKATGIKGVQAIDPAPRGALVLLTTASELVAWHRETARTVWRIPAPKSSAWAVDGSSVHVAQNGGVIQTLDAATGKQTASMRVEHKREFREVILHGPSGLAIFGIAGG